MFYNWQARSTLFDNFLVFWVQIVKIINVDLLQSTKKSVQM